MPSINQVIELYQNGHRDFSHEHIASGQTYLTPCLDGADFSFCTAGYNVVFRDASFVGCDFTGSDFSRCDFINCNFKFINCNFKNACLRDMDVTNTHFVNCDFTSTVFDPKAKMPPLRKNHGFEKVGRRLIGYRTKRSRFAGNNFYLVGETYTAPIFSVDTETECHPGLYVLPSHDAFYNEFNLFELRDYGMIKVSFSPKDLLEAGEKWRVKSFKVEEVLHGIAR